MALVLADRVQETTTTTGTGTLTLAGAVTGYQSFSTAIGNGNTTYYTISSVSGSEWEVGIGTYTSAGNTLSRDTVLSSSAGGTTKVTFSAGTKNVFVTYPAEKSVNEDASGNVGIGTTAPAVKLDVVNGDIRAYNGVLSSYGVAGTATLNLYQNSGNWRISNPGGYLQFYDITAAAERMRITSAGNVGIGTTTPGTYGTLAVLVNTNQNFYAKNTSSVTEIGSKNTANTAWNDMAVSGYSLRFNTGTNTEAMRISDTGNVGIGTASPVDKLQVEGNLYFGTSNRVVYTAGAGNLTLQTSTGVLAFNTGGSVERMRITSGGDVVIGASTANAKLDIQGGSIRSVISSASSAGSPLGSQIYLGDNNFGSTFALQGPGIGSVFNSTTNVAGDLALYTYSGSARTERARLDASGNLGLGVTPSAWVLSGYEAFEIGALGNALFSGPNDAWLTTNAYYNGGWKYATTQAATAYNQNAGTHSWRIAANGTAGTAISFTQAMTLDASGKLSLGTTNAYQLLTLNGSIHMPRGALVNFSDTASLTNLIGGDASNNMLVWTAGSERMRIDSSGNVGIGTSSPGFRLDVVNNVAGLARFSMTNPNAGMTQTDLRIGAGSGSNDVFFGINSTGTFIDDRSGGQNIVFSRSGSERFRIGPAGQIGLSGANYGTSGQVLTSNGSGSAPTWQTPSMTQAKATALSMILGF